MVQYEDNMRKCSADLYEKALGWRILLFGNVIAPWIRHFSVFFTQNFFSLTMFDIPEKYGFQCFATLANHIPVKSFLPQSKKDKMICFSGTDKVLLCKSSWEWLSSFSNLNFIQSATLSGNSCVDPRFHPTDIGWNLGLTQKSPTPIHVQALCLWPTGLLFMHSPDLEYCYIISELIMFRSFPTLITCPSYLARCECLPIKVSLVGNRWNNGKITINKGFYTPTFDV